MIISTFLNPLVLSLCASARDENQITPQVKKAIALIFQSESSDVRYTRFIEGWSVPCHTLLIIISQVMIPNNYDSDRFGS